MGNHRFNGPFRQSLLKTYSECPRKFRLLEVDKVSVEREKSVPLLIGSWVHTLAHQFHSEGKVDWEKHDIPPEILPEVKDLVNAYLSQNQGLEILHSEAAFAFAINSYEMAGTIDLIYRNQDGQVVLRDIKTDSTEPSSGFLARDIQFSVYYLGALRGLGVKPDLLEWYQLRNLVPYKKASVKNGVQFQRGDIRGDPRFFVARTEEDIPTIEREIKYIIQGIRFNIYPMRPLKIGHICPCNGCEAVAFCTPHGEQIEQRTNLEGLQGFQSYF